MVTAKEERLLLTSREATIIRVALETEAKEKMKRGASTKEIETLMEKIEKVNFKKALPEKESSSIEKEYGVKVE